MFITKTITSFLRKGDARSANLKKNILFSFLIKGFSIMISFIIIRLTLEFIDQARYGIWVTISSFISWFTFFDFGMANGLKNNIAKAIALKNYNKVRVQISTAYALFTLIAFAFFAFFLIINLFINWTSFFNIPDSINENIQVVMLIAAGTFCIQFIFQLINAILAAHQEPAKADFFNLLGQALVLVSILILMQTTAGSLKILIFALNFLPVLVLVVASLILFSVKFKAISPTIKHIDFRYTRKILKIGGVFFTIQIGALILFQTDIFIISKLLGPEAVTKFNIAYKLYSVIILFFSIIITPFWSAFTEAWVTKDYFWIKKSINRLRKLWLFTAFVISPVFFIISGYLFKIWLGQSVSISTTVSFLMMIYSISYTCLALNCYFLNGIGKLRVQLLLYVFVIFTNPLLCILLGRMFDIEGVIIANIIAFLFMNIILWIQNDKLIKQEATGIWDK